MSVRFAVALELEVPFAKFCNLCSLLLFIWAGFAQCEPEQTLSLTTTHSVLLAGVDSYLYFSGPIFFYEIYVK